MRDARAYGDTLATMSITNGEAGMLSEITCFINWMKLESAPLPETRKELNTLLARYLKFERREQMQRVSDERVERGLDPLPKYLLL